MRRRKHPVRDAYSLRLRLAAAVAFDLADQALLAEVEAGLTGYALARRAGISTTASYKRIRKARERQNFLRERAIEAAGVSGNAFLKLPNQSE